MKKFILSLFAFAAFTVAQAQEETENFGFNEGDMFISGSVGFGTTKLPDDSKQNQFNVIPRFGYFISEKIAVGAEIGYSKQKAEDSSGNDILDNSTFNIGVFGRYYFLSDQKFNLFGQLGLGYGHTKDIADNKVNGINADIMPGINYFISEHFALEATFGILGYSSAKPDIDGAESTDSFNVGLNMDDINLGLIYKF
ncbi:MULTISPECIES: outer membrane beta-barrel protein [Mesonia]|uniref:Outer membrane protein beta-barrel domain-containing protein n=1 Tax=Mesonia mobilis TaxID=369791 RepID=A0ABQ3BMZ5_9FLAO|nr:MULTISPECIES: outer membrane beta-barrel protein [Mesonia]MBQ0738142.1 porin family protein [Aquimarina celericrescens]GGZ52226.1 hypothetical protein GCM10008088_12300 [Mesonia mobilis]HIB36969.1 porin family protein [Mesonia sp.]HIO26356.1 porin family protein [Flavobacteriaceae bacterium]